MNGAGINGLDGKEVCGTRGRACVIAAAVALIVGVHIAGRVGAYCSPLSSDDSYIFAGFGCRMAHGDVLYRDMSDIKPPGLFMVYGLVYRVAPAVRAAVVPVETVFLLLGYAAVYYAAAEAFGRRAALAVTVLSALTINYFSVTGVAIVGFGVAENFMVFPAAATAWMYVRALRTGREGALLAAGVFMGVGTCLKQTALPLVVALTIHWTLVMLIRRRSTARWIRGLLRMFLGGCIGWAPAIALLAMQGTLLTAVRLLTSDAGAMLARGCAWPDEWRDVLPLWVPMVWAAWALARRIECGVRGESMMETGSARVVTFLMLWTAAEVVMLWRLPLRSPHYYVVSCVPFMLLAGVPIAAFGRSVTKMAPRARTVAWSVAVVLSGVFLRPVVDEIVPRAIGAYRSYDWAEEQRRFDEALDWGPIHFGRGDPFIAELER